MLRAEATEAAVNREFKKSDSIGQVLAQEAKDVGNKTQKVIVR